MRQRERREGLVLKLVKIPIPPKDLNEIAAAFERGITSRTKLILMSHQVNITGQITPVKAVCDMARAKGIETIVDGAHSFAQFDFKQKDLGCDYFGTSLHKWLYAPKGTGLLYVKRDKIEKLWPLMAAESKQSNDIRKFEEVGTHSAAPRLAIGEAMLFHHGMGGKRKEARLRYLSRYWMNRLKDVPKVRFNTSFDPEPVVRDCERRDRRRRSDGDRQLSFQQASHLRDADRARGVQRHPHHAKRLHHPRRARPLLQRNGEDRPKRPSLPNESVSSCGRNCKPPCDRKADGARIPSEELSCRKPEIVRVTWRMRFATVCAKLATFRTPFCRKTWPMRSAISTKPSSGRSAVRWIAEINWIDDRVAGGDRLREEWREKCRRETTADTILAARTFSRKK